MQEAPENGKESSHSAHANGMNQYYTFYRPESTVTTETRCAEIYQKSRSKKKSLQIVQNVHVTVAWHLVFVHPWLRHEKTILILGLNRLKKVKMTFI
jgi:hypothetical protein